MSHSITLCTFELALGGSDSQTYPGPSSRSQLALQMPLCRFPVLFSVRPCTSVGHCWQTADGAFPCDLSGIGAQAPPISNSNGHGLCNGALEKASITEHELAGFRLGFDFRFGIACAQPPGPAAASSSCTEHKCRPPSGPRTGTRPARGESVSAPEIFSAYTG